MSVHKKFFILTGLLLLITVVISSCASAGGFAALKNYLIGSGFDAGQSGNNAGGESISNPGAGSNKLPKDAQNRVVVIDPGHGGDDQGTAWDNVLEKDVNLDIALKLDALLKKDGIETVLTRDSDEKVSLEERYEKANRIGAAIFISIHNNALEGMPDFKGTETLYGADTSQNSKQFNGKDLARIIQDELIEKLKTIDNGIKYRPDLAVLHHTEMPAIITEIGYLSNSSDREKLISSEFKEKTALALADAVGKALEKIQDD